MATTVADIEERRQEILQSAIQSMAELNEGKLEFSEDLDDLKAMAGANCRPSQRALVNLRSSSSV